MILCRYHHHSSNYITLSMGCHDDTNVAIAAGQSHYHYQTDIGEEYTRQQQHEVIGDILKKIWNTRCSYENNAVHPCTSSNI